MHLKNTYATAPNVDYWINSESSFVVCLVLPGMNRQKAIGTIGMATVAILSIALVVGLSETQTTTAADGPNGNDAYIFADGVSPEATFKFQEKTVTYEFQGFNTVSNLFGNSGGFQTNNATPEFTLQKIVGPTPYLHRAVDETYEQKGSMARQEYPYQKFDVVVKLKMGGESVRTLKYGDCSVSNYKITAEFDKEEGYTTGGKTGFALLETYTFQCMGFKPSSPIYDTMKDANSDKYVPYTNKDSNAG